MATNVRQFGYAPYVQELTWNQAQTISVRAYLWGGGGGGGGNDSGRGGYGQGGGYSTLDFTLAQNDVLAIAVGGGGQAGVSGWGNAGGGAAGASYVQQTVFNTRTAVPYSGAIYPVTNGAYCPFLNTYGVWGDPAGAAGNFARIYQVYFPTTGFYTFTASCDNYGAVSLSGAVILNTPDFHFASSTTINVTAGYHDVQIVGVNTGGPGSMALTISGGTSYSGARGGNGGLVGYSGAGGGGGGATVLIKNGTVIAVAGGGGGGGGGGNYGQGETAPGFSGTASGYTNGQNGQNKSYADGGGGGGGGGGVAGGNGGPIYPNDVGGGAGVGGTSSNGSSSSNRFPAGTNSPYYSTARAYGGLNTAAGSSGWAALEFEVGGTFVNIDGNYTVTKNTWVKDQGTWRQVKSAFIKQNNVWTPILGSFAPTFSTDVASMGVNSRDYPDPGYGSGGGDGGGGGGIF